MDTIYSSYSIKESTAMFKKTRGVDEKLIKLIFDEEKIEISHITENKYFDLPKWQEKDKPSIEEWFSSLSIIERMLAVSTIFDK
mmetsp:Transcript_29028/g.33164  ORF Transcript_29028/g.33164 Transcript_29028/m.33164 type:complete len:84 (+) Transcript_29028:43-294(+)